MINKHEAKHAIQVIIGAAYTISSATAFVNNMRDTRNAAKRLKDLRGHTESVSPENVVTSTN